MNHWSYLSKLGKWNLHKNSSEVVLFGSDIVVKMCRRIGKRNFYSQSNRLFQLLEQATVYSNITDKDKEIDYKPGKLKSSNHLSGAY